MVFKIVRRHQLIHQNVRFSGSNRYMSTSQNWVEKVVEKYLVVDTEVKEKDRNPVRAGDFVTLRPHHILTHDNSGAVINKFKSIGLDKIYNPKQPVFALDHDVQNKSDANLTKYANIEKFASNYSIDFYPAGRGIGHQIMIEEGYAFPETLTVASDSHSNMYGGIGCLGTPLVRTDAAAIWATGKTWWQVPKVIQLKLKNRLRPGVTGKDVIVTLCALFNKGEVLNCAVEFSGKESIQSLSIDDRLAISNMSTEWGALAAIFPPDSTTLNWLQDRKLKLGLDHPRINTNRINQLEANFIESDPDAHYFKKLELDLDTVQPYVSGPNSVTVASSVADLMTQNIKVHKAYLVSCVNSRLSDIQQAAQIFQGQKVHPDVEFYVAAASSQVQKDAEFDGAWNILKEAGAIFLPPGCGPCVGLGVGLLKDGEVGISATNRNFKGRMGSRNALAYLASPAVVAASAIAGKICLPTTLLSNFPHSKSKLPEAIQHQPPPLAAQLGGDKTYPLVPNFPTTMQGPIIFCGHTDNLNTDGIYAGVHTYNDKLTKPEMAKVIFENYDPNFINLVQEGDVLIGGYNFGTGSSREQAATALLAAGIQIVIAGSYSETYKRNSINNGLIVLESPPLIEYLRTKIKKGSLTEKLQHNIQIDFQKGKVSLTDGVNNTGEVKVFELNGGLGTEAQKLFLLGGLENWIKNELNLQG